MKQERRSKGKNNWNNKKSSVAEMNMWQFLANYHLHVVLFLLTRILRIRRWCLTSTSECSWKLVRQACVYRGRERRMGLFSFLINSGCCPTATGATAKHGNKDEDKLTEAAQTIKASYHLWSTSALAPPPPTLWSARQPTLSGPWCQAPPCGHTD